MTLYRCYTEELYSVATSSLHPRPCFGRQNFRVSVNTGHETETNSSPDGLGNLALVDGPQTRHVSVLYPTHRGDIFRHNREVLRSTNYQRSAWIARQNHLLSFPKVHDTLAYLIQIQGVQVQGVKGISRGTVTLPPFLHLCRAEIMRGIEITGFPFTRLKPLQSPALTLSPLLLEKSAAVHWSTAAVVHFGSCVEATD